MQLGRLIHNQVMIFFFFFFLKEGGLRVKKLLFRSYDFEPWFQFIHIPLRVHFSRRFLLSPPRQYSYVLEGKHQRYCLRRTTGSPGLGL